jgi:hypothetical protein
MKKLIAAMLVLAIVALLAPALFAGSVYDRSVVTNRTTTGAWTNGAMYAAVCLKQIFVYNNSVTGGAVTIKRVTDNGYWTNTVGTVTTDTSGNGSTASFTAYYMVNGDVLTFSNANSTNTALIEYEVQKH